MLARLVRELPGDGYLYEPKWDGFRCLAERDGLRVELASRHGRPLGRYFPELIGALSRLAAERWTIDGEVLVLVAGRFDFAALMGRLHPATSRVHELAERTPAIFVAFDLPRLAGQDLGPTPFAERRRLLVEGLGEAGPPLFVTPATADRALAARWLEQFGGGGLDGVVAKHRELPYTPGARAMLKIKHERTVDCVVAGIRLANEPAELSSLMFGLYDGGSLEHIGVASAFARPMRRELARELAPLAAPLERHPWAGGFLAAGGPLGRLKGAAGRWMPGMSIDWVPVAPERVCEVAYTQVDGRRLRHPAKLVRWRPDREPASCLIDQLDTPAPPVTQLLSQS